MRQTDAPSVRRRPRPWCQRPRFELLVFAGSFTKPFRTSFLYFSLSPSACPFIVPLSSRLSFFLTPPSLRSATAAATNSSSGAPSLHWRSPFPAVFSSSFRRTLASSSRVYSCGWLGRGALASSNRDHIRTKNGTERILFPRSCVVHDH